MTMTYDGTNGITFPDSSLQKTAGYSPFRNRIINGDMRIDQRNAGASVTPAGSTYLLDRWLANLSQASKISFQQNAGSVTPPNEFNTYLGATSLSAYTVGSSEQFLIGQRIEGFNVADLAWGTASAKPVTLSFWVYSSLTGVFGGSLRNSSGNRSYPFSYVINSSNTWEQKTITVLGDTSGTWLTTNGIGINIGFSLGAGSSVSGIANSWAGAGYVSATGATSVVGTSGATFYITGVQLEKGSTATPFEYRPYGTELALCQRYYERQIYPTNIPVLCAQATANTYAYGVLQFSIKRTAPTIILSSSFTASKADGTSGGGTWNMYGAGTSMLRLQNSSCTGLVAGNACLMVAASDSSIELSAEL